MLGRDRRSVHQEFVIDGVGTEEGPVISKSFSDYFIAYPKSIHDGILATNHDFSCIKPMCRIRKRRFSKYCQDCKGGFL